MTTWAWKFAWLLVVVVALLNGAAELGYADPIEALRLMVLFTAFIALMGVDSE